MITLPIAWLLVGLTSMAFGLSGWIALKTSGTSRLPGCGEGSGCAALAASRWSRWTLLPVAAVGAMLYLALDFLLLLFLTQIAARHSDLTERMIAGLSILLGGSALWFAFLQIAVVRKACIYCNLVHLLGLTIFVIVAFQILHNVPTNPTKNSPDLGGKPILAGVGGLLLLVAGQLLWRPKTYAVVPAEPTRDSPTSQGHALLTASPSPARSEASQPPCKAVLASGVTPSAREVSLLDGRCRLSASDWPIVGSADATHLIAILFDYTCPTCRVVHRLLNELVEQDRSWLAVLVLPVPQNPACNPTVTQIYRLRGQACQYARLAIGVWQSRPDAYEEFEKYLFETPELPLLGVAMQRAKQITGVQIDPHRPDDQFDDLIRRSVELYRSAGVEKIPRLLVPKASVAGQFQSVAELRRVLAQELRK